ncbi:loricrin-like [Pistacia vera]|uniref:loricrin-like n=1 Tax=Pistacia vera TaxID=55513 RepID=UPI001263136B|nr:loricrin-like [Pistacia vera]
MHPPIKKFANDKQLFPINICCEFRLKQDSVELFDGVDGVCGGGEAFGGSDSSDGDEFEGDGGLVGGLATGGGGGEFVGVVNTGGGEGELLGGLDTSSGGDDELIGGLDAIGGDGGRDELVSGLEIGGDGGGGGGGDVGEIDC